MASQVKTDIDLMQLVDGELDDRAAADVRAVLERDPEARTKLESLEQMTELVRGHLELSSDAVPDRRFEAMWREVDKSILSTQLATERESSAQLAVAGPVGMWGKVSSWLERHRGHVFTGVASAGVVAAVALMLRPDGGDELVRTNPNAIDVQPAALRSPPVIEDLETPGGNGTVLNIEDDEGHMTVIVVTPDDTVEGI